MRPSLFSALSTRARAVAVGAVLLAAVAAPGPASASIWDAWTPAASMNGGHYLGSSAVLPNGDVLVAGGEDASGTVTAAAETYDPATNAWTTVAPMSTPRYAASAIALPSGDVLVVGGGTTNSGGQLNSGEVFDPASGTWTPVANTMSSPRGDLPAVAMLPGGEVMIAGGGDGSGAPVASTDIYDPADNSFSPGPPMNQARSVTAAVALPDGRILVAGGIGSAGQPIDTAEVYSPSTASWSLTADPMSVARAEPLMAPSDGEVMVTGGADSDFAQPGMTTTSSTDMFDPATDSFSAGPPLEVGRVAGGILPLSNGQVMVTGGITAPTGTIAVAGDTEIYSPTTDSWSEAGAWEGAAWFALEPLSDGQVLEAGGTNSGAGALTQANLFTPYTVPGAPLTVSATASGHSAYVTFAPPATDGGTMIESYTVTASTGQSVTSPNGSTFATVNRLRDGQPVTFTVTATNSVGAGPASAPSNAVTPGPADTAPTLRISGLPRRMTLARFLRGVDFTVKANEAVKLQIKLIGHVNRAMIARVDLLTLAAENTRMRAGRRRIRLVPAANLVGRPLSARVEIVIVATDRFGGRTTVSRWATVVGGTRPPTPPAGCAPDARKPPCGGLG